MILYFSFGIFTTSVNLVDALHPIRNRLSMHSVMTAHVELKQDVSVSQLRKLKDELRHGLDVFDFVHTTIEIEFANEDCRDE